MTPEPRSPALEQAILADPDDDAQLRVYGDWLETQGHPRGPLVALHARGLATEAYLTEHPELWGAVRREAIADARWRLGFIDRARLVQPPPKKGKRDPDEPTLEVTLGALLDGPGRFLRELVVGIVDHWQNGYHLITAELARRGPLPALRTIEYGDFTSDETELNWSTIGDLSPLYAAVPRLRRLWLRSGEMQLGAIDLPELRELIIISGGVDRASAAAIAAARVPALETLDVMFGAHGRETLRTIDPIAPLLERRDLPALRRLGLKNLAFRADLIAALAASPLVAQLTALDLAMGVLGDRDAEQLAAAGDRFRHLAELDVSANYLTERGLAALATIGCPIVSREIDGPFRWIDQDERGQRVDEDADPDDPDDDSSRYSAVYE